MLSKIDIDTHIYKKYRDLLNLNYRIIDTSNEYEKFNWYILYNTNHRLVAVAKNQQAIKDLTNDDKFLGMGFSTFEMKESPKISFRQNESWKYRLDITKKNWAENYIFSSFEELDELILTNQKAFYLDKVYDFINAWYSTNTPSPTQQNTYFMKYLEAKDILDKNIDEDLTGQYPHVLAYAKLKNISLQNSAKQIKFQYDNTSAIISEAEFLRLKHKQLIIEETDFRNLKNHYEKFIINFVRYGGL